MLRVLITRSVASPMDVMLRESGACPVHVPLLSLRPTLSPPPPGRPGLVLISSASTASAVPHLAGVLAGAEVVAVGEKTAAALRRIGVSVAEVGDAGGAEVVARMSRRIRERGADSAWVVGARQLSPQLSEALDRVSWRPIRWSVYENLPPRDTAAALAEALPVDVITLASGSAARVLAASADPGDAAVVVIGPSTAEDARSVGLSVHAVAARPSLEALVAAALEEGAHCFSVRSCLPEPP